MVRLGEAPTNIDRFFGAAINSRPFETSELVLTTNVASSTGSSGGIVSGLSATDGTATWDLTFDTGGNTERLDINIPNFMGPEFSAEDSLIGTKTLSLEGDNGGLVFPNSVSIQDTSTNDPVDRNFLELETAFI